MVEKVTMDVVEGDEVKEKTVVDVLALAREMALHPSARRFAAKAKATGDNTVQTADDVFGERFLRLASLIMQEYEDPGSVLIPDGVLLPRREFFPTFAIWAENSPPYLWNHEVHQTAIHTDVPRHVISPRCLPQPKSWHTFEASITPNPGTLPEGAEAMDIDAFLVRDVVRGFEVFFLGEIPGSGKPVINAMQVEYGKVFPDDFENKVERDNVHCILALFSFLSSPYIPKEQKRVSRSLRRENTRAKAPLEDDLVTFVTLRRAQTKKTDDATPTHVEWQHQWIVSGHIRAQWYPSEQAHHLIWIAPYMKGPSDAPLLEHAYRVRR